jgi:hypothetical protein
MFSFFFSSVVSLSNSRAISLKNASDLMPSIKGVLSLNASKLNV